MMEEAEPHQAVPQPSEPALTFALQALLARHEAYMASAERDRAELNARIEQLQLDNAALQQSNDRTIEENRALLGRLAQLNGTVSESELKIRSLEAALQETQLTIKRLESAAARAADMERHIATLEGDQERMQKEVAHSEEEARSALYRWRMAERSLRDMQDQLERMEKEAKEERERHVEVIGRMERQRAMEKDLDTAAGRLKGAAAAKNLTDGKNGSSVVSHFVRDLLQDNANLQLSMAELREMLMNSNDEIQSLREQLMYHQPVKGEVSAASTLRAELEPPTPVAEKRISQELHVHHHYHVAPKAELKKPKKKRHSLNPGVFTPPAVSTPSTPNTRRWQLNKSSPSPAMLSHTTKGSITSLPPPRWSYLSDEPSDFTLSSVPSSPQSNHGNSMFDRGVVDLSLPASPTTSVDPTSPSWFKNAHRKRSSEASIRPEFGRSVPINFNLDSHISKDAHPASQLSISAQKDPGHEEPQEATTTPITAVSPSSDDVPSLTPTATASDESVLPTYGDDADANDDTSLASPVLDYFDPDIPQVPRALRRVVSHESIMSLSNGMDIHTLKVRPSQLTLRPLGATAAGTGISTVTASPTISRGGGAGKRGSVVLRDNLELVGLGLSTSSSRGTTRVVSGPTTPRDTLKSPSQPSQSARSPLGRLVSWRLWGSPEPPSVGATRTPEPPTAMPAAVPSSGSGPPSISDARSTASDSTGASSKPAFELKPIARPPGINQAGAIPGFYEYWAAHQRRRAPSKVCPDVVDQEALREGLEGA